MKGCLITVSMLVLLGLGAIGIQDSDAKKPATKPSSTTNERGKRLSQHFGQETEAMTCSKTLWVTRAAESQLARHEVFMSRIVGREVSFHIMLPPSYEASQKNYPLMIWLHGSGPSTRGLGQVAAIYHRLMRTGRIPEMILLFPNGLTNSMWVDSKDGCTPVESVVVTELIPHVRKAYRTIDSRGMTIVEGHSMGGYGALRFGFKYPQTFGLVSALGPGPLQESLLAGSGEYVAGERVRESVFHTIYGGSEAYFKQASPLSLARKFASRAKEFPIRLRIITGGDDEGYDATDRFHRGLTQLGIVHAFTVLNGVGHAPAETFRSLQGPSQRSTWLGFYSTSQNVRQQEMRP